MFDFYKENILMLSDTYLHNREDIYLYLFKAAMIKAIYSYESRIQMLSTII